MTRLRVAFGVGLVAVLVGGLVWFLATRGSSGGAHQSASSTTLSPSASTPSPTESPTPSPPEVPTPDLTGSNFSTIVRNMNDFRHWLYQHPDPSLVGEIYDLRCACYGRFQQELQTLQQKGLRYADQGVLVDKVTVVNRVSQNSVVLEVTTHQGQQLVVDATTGAVDARGPGWPPKRALYSFQRESDGSWRVVDFTWIDPPPPTLKL
jgi:hypothetical protein